MQKFIILFRGINVGGNNILPIKEFVAQLKAHGFENVSSYIQSGNLALKYMDDPTEKVQTLVNENYGFKPEVFLLKEMEFADIFSNNPYNGLDGKFIHFYFCKNDIELNQELVNKVIDETEQYVVKDNVLYLSAPKGIGRSKFVSEIEACLGQKATGRNLNTVAKLSSMLKNL